MDNLLLLHGALGAKSQFAEIEKSLSANYNVLSINFSGHGGEPIPNEPFSIEMFAEDVLEYLDVNRINKTNIFGYSMGGYVALYLAKKYPNRTGKIFTLATKFEWTEVIAMREIKMLDANRIKEKVPKYAEELSNRHSLQNWETGLTKTTEMMLNLGKKNSLLPEDFSLIKHEVLIGIGDGDKMVTLEETIDVYRKLKNGRLLIIPNTPHPLEQVNIERLVYEIRNFCL